MVTRAAPSSGRMIGGVPLTNGPLAHILRNRVYAGELNHKGASYPGEHAAIVTRALFDAVQEKLTANRNGAKVRRAASVALLIGRIFDDRGHPMTPSTAKKGSIRYRYYVVGPRPRPQEQAGDDRAGLGTRDRGRGRRCTPGRVPGRRCLGPEASSCIRPQPQQARSRSHGPRPPPRGRREILASQGSEGHDRGIKAEARTVLLRSIALGRRWLDEVLGGATIDEIADRERCTKRHVADTLPLAFLAPGLVRAVIEARLPRGISTRSIAEPELEWSRQWTTLGISARPASLA